MLHPKEAGVVFEEYALCTPDLQQLILLLHPVRSAQCAPSGVEIFTGILLVIPAVREAFQPDRTAK